MQKNYFIPVHWKWQYPILYDIIEHVRHLVFLEEVEHAKH